MQAIARLQAEAVLLPHSFATSVQYAEAMKHNRSLLRLCGEGDCWIIAQAMEFELPLVTHDRNAATLARAAGVEVLTLLPAP